MIPRQRLILVIFICLVVFISGCAEVQRKERKPSADWSRSLILGGGVNGSPGLAIDGASDQVHIVWPYEEEGQQHLHYLRLDGQAEWGDVVVRVVEGDVKAPRLIPATTNTYHLIWGERDPGEKTWALRHLLLGPDRSLSGEPVQLSANDENIGKYSVASDGSGGVVLAWDNGGLGQVSVLHIGPNGRPLHSPRIVTNQGELPSVQVDKHGHIHLAWVHEKRIHYTHLNTSGGAVDGPTVIADLRQGGNLESTGDTLQSPSLGIDHDWVYVFWSVLSNSDTDAVRHSAGTGRTSFVSFQVDQASLSPIQEINTLKVEKQPHFDYQGVFSLTQLNPALNLAESQQYGVEDTKISEAHGDWQSIASVSNYMMSPSASNGQTDELAIAMTTTQMAGFDERMQIATAVFKDGQYQGYSIASRTRRLSDDPVIVTDEAGNLHLLWREGAGGKELYYATTAPIMREAIDRFGPGDILSIGLEAGLDSFTGMFFLPVYGFWWILVGFPVVLVWSRFKKTNEGLVNWVPILLAFVAYYLVKLFLLPSFISYVPFSAWVYVPSDWQLPLRMVLPLLILLTSLLIAIQVKRRYDHSIVGPYLALAMTDALLTLAIYGVTMFGAV
jgi:hypothetical protein